MEITLTHSQRKFVRTQKSLIRNKFSDPKKQEEMITELYKKFTSQPASPEVKQEKAKEEKVEKKEAKKADLPAQVEKKPKDKKGKPN
jgi:hypothetical protein